MLLSDLVLGGVTVPDGQDQVYQARLDAAINQAQEYCKRDFKDDEGVLDIPPGAKIGIALIVKSMTETQNVQSQSLGDMAKSFFEGGTYKSALLYLKPFRKMKVF
jgi:hypothetical protein